MIYIKLLLLYFDSIRGPSVYHSVPKPISEEFKDTITKLLDIANGEGFFEHHQKTMDSYSSANYFFEISSKLARGNKEMLMLTLITDPDQNPTIFQKDLKKYADIFKNDGEIYQAFYFGTKKQTDSSEIKNNQIIEHLNTCFEECKRNKEAQKPGKMVILGLQAVGKSSIINRLKSGEFNNNIKPTLGMQIIKSVVDNFSFRIYDVGGQKKLRKDWVNTPLPNAIIYVLDTTASIDQHKETRAEFDRMINYYFNKEKLDKGIPVLILGNKIDLNDKFGKEEIEKILEPKKYDINYRLGLISAKDNINIDKNFKWLVKEFLFL